MLQPCGCAQIDDVDALIEAELTGAKDGLPPDLAAKLAKLEAHGQGSDDDEEGAAGVISVQRDGGVGQDSLEGPSIYALMNSHKQGSWRA